jgi:xylulose-5-phosphate/fructose-6-phosphate phosphoketolase
VHRFGAYVAQATERYWAIMERHKLYVGEHGEDMPEVASWRWPAHGLAGEPATHA